MQKLQVKLKNVPKDTHQVSCSTNFQLNKEETLSVENIILTCNNSNGDQSELNQKQNMSVSVKVFVLNMRGKPLMPCSSRKAKVLLKQGKAKVIKRIPFTIQLTIATGETKQDITLGVDNTGYSNIGVSAITKKEELISATFQVRTNISDLLKERAMYRRGRRNRLWYREEQ